MRRLLSVVFWSVVAAAFIGPGTVTTAAKAGAEHGVTLLWALLFSTVACLVLQEGAARLTSVSGKDLGRALRERSRRAAGGAGGVFTLVLVLAAIVVGCAAYEAGNLLGAAAGVSLATGWSEPALAAVAGLVAAVLLWLGAPRSVAHGLSVLVAVMGVAFLGTALFAAPPVGELARGLLVPTMPDGSLFLVLGLVGTTVVPYNLFLGSGLAAGRDLGEIRFGLTVAVVLGGIISMGVLAVGASVPGEFSYPALAEALGDRLGPWSGVLFAWGLAAAGLTSAVTAPLAAAITARGLFAEGPDDPRWSPSSWRWRAVWGGVVAVGVACGVSGLQPVPAILLAQAANGVLLPVVAFFLFRAVNDRELLGHAVNGPLANVLTVVVLAVSLVLGGVGLGKAFGAW